MPSDPPSLLTAPTPVSGLCVTDASPSPHAITLRYAPAPAARDHRPEVASAFRRLLDPLRPALPPPGLVGDVQVMVKAESIKAIISEDYDYADRLDRAAASLRAYVTTPVVDRCTEAEATLSRRLGDARRELSEETEQWDRAIEFFREERRRERDEMLERHSAEQREYGEKWAAPGALLPFSKPSSELLKMRKMQKDLALAKRFDEARQIKRQVEAMQAVEAKAGEQRAMAAIRAGYQALQERQQKEKLCFDGHETRNALFLEQEKQRAIEPLEMRIKAIKNGREENFVQQTWKARKIPSQAPVLRYAPVVTAHARSRLNDFRNYDGPERLNLDTHTVRRFATRKRTKGNR
jgi:hypothetical protein